MSRRRSYCDWKRWGPIAICALFLIVAVGFVFFEPLSDEFEIVSTKLFPDPEREFAYGEQHFDPSNPKAYNIDLAEYFFREAAQLDPSLPYLYHEIARIDFLKGNLSEALVEIDVQISMHGDSQPKSYYVRGLIEGYMGDYADAVTDYQQYLEFDPNNWAAQNDEAWVLLKAGRYQEALQVTDNGLAHVSANAWLLNSKATALYELGEYQEALATVNLASTAVSYLTPQEWSVAYPGNDPAIAAEGLATFKTAVADNMHTIKLALASSTVQSK